VDLLAETVRGSGATCVRILQADAARPLPFRAEFDRVLLDAPCSGLGTIRRDPDIKWRRAEQDFKELTAAQVLMLEHTSRVLRPGGRLIYSTCSSEPEENEAVIARFLADRPWFTSVVPDNLPPAGAAMLTEGGDLRTLPFRDGLEAFFAAVLVKTADSQ
jgi:16S rRNA (cytosine967-C5)-methyltransferase